MTAHDQSQRTQQAAGLLAAERVGFEPTEPHKRFNGFRDRRLRPLGHLSVNRQQPPTGGIVTNSTTCSSAGGKEVLQQFLRFLLPDPGDDIAAVIEALVLRDVVKTPNRTRFGVGCGIHDTV